MSPRCALLVTVLMAGCGDDPAHVSLEPVPLPASCGRPKNATGIRVTAHAADGDRSFAVGLTETLDLSTFPESTEQISVEVAIGGGNVGAIGKTAPLVFGDLENKAVIPIVMLPPNGFCETAGFMSVARRGPLVARAGDGVLVVGGRDANGTWLGSAEYYDPATATFTPVEVSDVLGSSGFAGTSLVTLPDGRVAISGGPRPVITMFDPVTKTLGESVLIDARSFHTSIALDDDRLLLAGGCAEVASGMCNGLMLNSSRLYDTKKIDEGELGPVLRVARIGATALPVGVLDDGKPWFAIAGGVSPPSHDPLGADLITPDGDVATLTGINAQVAALDGGAVISAFAPDGEPAAGPVSILAPGARTARATALAPMLTGIRLVTLEDGHVAGFGDASKDVLIYDPTADRWQTTAGANAPAITAPTLIRLGDGSVLVFDGGAPSQTVYLYRPSLIGPASGSTAVVPTSATAVLTAPDAETVVRTSSPPTWSLVSTGDLARALVGGPRTASGSVRATVTTTPGSGVALLAQQTGPGQVLVGELVPGAKARIVRRDGATQRVLCSGKTVDEVPSTGANPRLEISGTTARLFQDDADEVASCDIGVAASGQWGVAAVGAGARVTLQSVTVNR